MNFPIKSLLLIVFAFLFFTSSRTINLRNLEDSEATSTDVNLSNNATNETLNSSSNASNGSEVASNSSDLEKTNNTNISQSNISQESTQNLSNITYMSLKDKKNLTGTNCHKYVIDKKFKSVELELKKLQNVDHVLISEVEVGFNVCNAEVFRTCSDKSHYCIYEDDLKNEVEFKIQHCFPKLFVYIYINNTNLTEANAYGEIDVEEYDDDELCEDIKANDWNYCHNLTLENCSSNDSKICDKRCKWVRCNYLVNQQANNFSQCVPSYLPAKNESNEICITNVDFNQSITKSIDFKYCGLVLNSEETSIFKKVGRTWSIVGVAFVFLMFVLCLFFISVCWYRYKLNNSKVPPFTPPACCPECLFPHPPNPVEYNEQPEIGDSEYQQIKEK